MNKYQIFRMPSEDDENYGQHELIGVEFGEDIYEATDRLIESICDDLSENPEYAGCHVYAYPPEDEYGAAGPYQYQMNGIVSPPAAEENIVVIYGIVETEAD